MQINGVCNGTGLATQIFGLTSPANISPDIMTYLGGGYGILLLTVGLILSIGCPTYLSRESKLCLVRGNKHSLVGINNTRLIRETKTN
jgi:hypothetical protein